MIPLTEIPNPTLKETSMKGLHIPGSRAMDCFSILSSALWESVILREISSFVSFMPAGVFPDGPVSQPWYFPSSVSSSFSTCVFRLSPSEAGSVVNKIPTPRRPKMSGVPRPGIVRTGDSKRAGNVAGHHREVAGYPSWTASLKIVWAWCGGTNWVPTALLLVGRRETLET